METKGANFLCFFLGLCFAQQNVESVGEKPLVPIFEWSQLEFEYNSPLERQRDIDSGFFIPGVPAIIDVDVYYAADKTNHVFVTIPRFLNGSPVALGEVTFDTYRGNYLIKPYPSWSWQRNPRQCNRNRIISVYRIQIDKCGRMWVLDTGRYGDEIICPPQILAFDLETNELIHRYELPQDQYESRSIFVTPIVDIRESCRDTFVYAADCQTYSLVVYDTRRQQSWRVIDKTFYPYPNYGTYNILGDSFELMDGILGMSLTPYVKGRDRKLFFHAMSSDTENWVYTADLRNQSRFDNGPFSTPEIFHTYRGRRSSQVAAEAVDRNGVMYFGLLSEVTFNCWDTSTDYGSRSIKTLDNNKTILQFASGVKVITNKIGGEELFVVTSRFQKVAAGTLNTNEINFRILAGKIDQRMVQKCKSYASSDVSFQAGSLTAVGGGYGFKPNPFYKFRPDDEKSEHVERIS